MGDIKQNLFITSYDFNKNRIEVFNNIQQKYKDLFLLDVLESSMAAPTLLPMKIILFENEQDEIDGNIYMDAGIV